MNNKLQIELINQQIRELAGIYQEAVGIADISVNEFWIWYSLIIIGGEYSQQDLCTVWSLSKQTVNTIITHMAHRGFISLEVVPGTRNRKIIRLTESGIAYGKKVVLPVFRAEERAFEKLTVEDRAIFSGIFNKYIEALREEIDGISGQRCSPENGISTFDT